MENTKSKDFYKKKADLLKKVIYRLADARYALIEVQTLEGDADCPDKDEIQSLNNWEESILSIEDKVSDYSEAVRTMIHDPEGGSKS